MPKIFTATAIRLCLGSALALGLFMTPAAEAQDEPLLISNSRSPNGKLEIWIKPVPLGQGYASGTSQIRSVATGKTLDTFEWSGFGESPDSKAFTVLWRPDCKFFAITWEISRGYVTSAVYGFDRNRGWTETKLPRDDYVGVIRKMNPPPPEAASGNGHETAEKWLPDGTLALEFGSREILYDDDGNPEKEYVVILQVQGKALQPLPTARVRSIKLEPR